MIIRTYLSFLLLLVSIHFSYGQMVVGPDTLVGNEWIRYDQSYYKFLIQEDGVYRINQDILLAAGITSEDLKGSDIRIYNMGRQVPLYLTTQNTFGPNDYMEFFGYKNRGELDHFLYRNADSTMLNPEYSMYSDFNAYYLTIEDDNTPLRVVTVNNDLSNPPPKEDFYLHTEKLLYSEQLHDAYFTLDEGGSISYSSYMYTEGFGKRPENSNTIQIPALNRYISGPEATLRLRLATTNWTDHSLTITFNDVTLDVINLLNQQIADKTYSIPLSLLTDDNQLKITAGNTLSRHSIVTIELTYPHTSTVASTPVANITLSGQPGNQHYILSGFPFTGMLPVIYTYDGLSRMVPAMDGLNNILFNWPETLGDLKLVITDPVNGVHNVTSLELKTFTDLSSKNTEYIIITHPSLMQIGTGSEYIQYRSSVAGGAYRSEAYSILDLYEQFGYGVEKHPQSIRNFVEYMHRHWPSAKMIFIVGRAIEYDRSRIPGGAWESSFFVPTFGRPGTDNLLAATLWDLVPRYPVARLAVTNSSDISAYLKKAKEHDASKLANQTLEEKAWMKKVMHIGGGITAGEQENFRSDLLSMAKILEDSDYGSKTFYFQKQSTEFVEESQSAQIAKLLKEGVSIVNYLGHSSASTFEFNIVDPSVWNNTGRYPVFSAMGCNAGAIHGTILSLSDRYVLIPDEGAIAFVSGSGSQFANALINWGRPWYEYIGNVNYGGSLGESVLYALDATSNFVDVESNNRNPYRFLLEQQTIQGDPAIRFHPFPGPDYLVDRKSVSISPAVLDTKLDSFDVSFSIANIGRNLGQDLEYSILIKKPNGEEALVKESIVTADAFESVITARLPLLIDGKAGSFRMLIRLDPDNLLHELPAPDAENNNELVDNLGVEGIEFFVVDNVISAVYPPDFAIVTKSQPNLIATSSNAFAKGQDIILEIDTTALFNSPLLVRELFPNHSAILKWSPPISFINDRVYYWRVSTDSISPEKSYNWSSRSFIYKPGYQNGWNQSHFYQFTDNQLDFIEPDSQKFDFKFQRTVKNFRMVNRYHDVDLGLVPLFFEDGKFNARLTSVFRNTNVHGFVVAIDSTTGNYLWNTTDGLYGSTPWTVPMQGFAYNLTDPASRQAMINLIENVIPAGYYVFFYTYQHTGFPDYQPETWDDDEITFGKSIYTTIEAQYPGSAIRTLTTKGSVPYIILFQKDVGVIEEQIASSIDDVIAISFDGGASLSSGTYLSSLIGPSQKWHSIENDFISHNDSTGASILSAFALNESRTDTFWISHDLNQPVLSITNVDANLYPYIQLKLTTSDSSGYNPANIEYWRVLYDGYPDVIINPDLGFEFVSDTLFQGQLMRISTYVENIGDYPIDSIPISLRIISEDNSTVELSTVTGQLASNSAALVQFEKTTETFDGHYQVLLEVNTGRALKEAEYGNNIGILPMYVQSDNVNPVLDVTFDGVHILDGDLVSSKPLIVVRLHDENTFLILDDTSTFELYLQFPSDFQPRRIYFSESWVEFVASTENGKNIAYVEMNPELFEDGIYKLQVKARDASGNTSGDNDYLITFEVINEESISHLYNYPNPFSTATRFVYTLTGSGSPAHYKIQIMSITGRIVREITQDELGALNVGTHMTAFVWDGTDEYGNPLSAGTYLYRMVVKNDDLEDIKHYETSGDSFFNKGWGKMVILR